MLAEHNIPVDFIAGTSAGAIVGGAYASGIPVAQLEELSQSVRWRDIGRMTLSRLGVQSNARMEEFIRERFPVTRFEEMPVPFAVVATDLHAGTPVVMKDQGDAAFAIRASCAIPGWYVPVEDAQGRLLIDGGLVANVPAAAARSLGAHIVIAVDVNAEGARFWGPPQSAIGVLLQAMMVIQRTAAAGQYNDADVVITPKVGHIRWDEMGRARELIAAGEQATRVAIDRIKVLLAPPVEESPKWFTPRRRLLKTESP